MKRFIFSLILGIIASPVCAQLVADFVGVPTTVCVGQTVQFTDLTTGNPTSWTWSFPGGTPNSSTLQNPVVTYNTAGVYSVTLQASNGMQFDFENKINYITVISAPAQPGLITGLQTVCANQTGVTYSIGAVTGATSYVWTVPAGATITAGQGTTSITVNWGTTGGNVCVSAVNACGTSTPRCLAVTVNSPPAAPGPITGLSAVCPNQTGVIYSIAAVTGASSYTWTVPAGSTITGGQGTTSITVNWGTTGGNVCVTANNSCGSSAPTCLAVTIVAGPPAAPGPISGPTAVCSNQTGTVYSISAVANASGYAWTVPAGATITAGQGTTSITVSWGTTGGNVCVTAFNGCGSSPSTCLAVTVNPSPAQPGAISGLSTVCAGQTSVTYSISAVAGATSYTWTVPSGVNIVSGQGTTSIVVNFTISAVTGNICVTANNATCSSTPSCRNVTVQTAPAAPGPITGVTSVCANQTGVVYSITSVPGATSYTWTVPAGASITSGQGTTSITVTFGSASGSVCVVATNICGSSAPNCVTVTVNPGAPAAPGPITGPTIVCANQAGITYSISPVANAASYTWTVPFGTTIVSGQGTTSITVNFGSISGNICVTASNGCGTSTQTCLAVTVVFGAPAQPGAITGPNPVCANATGITYSIAPVANASSYYWTVPSGSTVTTGQGTVSITVAFGSTSGNICVTAINACDSSAFTCRAITVNAIPVVTVSPSSASICPGGSVTLVASGASSYTWSPSTGLNTTSGNTVVASPGVTTTYTVIGSNGTCADTATAIVSINPGPTVTVSPANPTICTGGSVQLTANGAVSYTWSPATGLNTTTGASVTASPAVTTTYSVIGTDASGCSDTGSVTVTVSPGLNVTVSPSGPAICTGGSVTLTASGASSYTWSPGTGLSATTGAVVVASPASTTTYTVIGSSGTCSDTTTVTVTVNSNPVVAVSPSSSSICAGNSVMLTASGATSYNWSPSTGLSATTGAIVTAGPLTTTTYTVVGTDGNGCTGSATALVTVNSNPTVTVAPATSTICQGNSVSLTASGATSYVWTPSASLNTSTGAAVVASPTVSTTYTVIGTNAAGCSDTTTAVVNVDPAISVTVSPSSASICTGGSVTLSASGATSYLWSPSSGLNTTTSATVIASSTITTTYSVIGSAGSCADTATVTVTVNSLPNVTITPASTTICAGASTTLTTSGASTYTWSPTASLNTSTGAIVVATPGSTTTYTVIGTDGNGCSNSATALVTVNPLPTVAVTPSSATICNGDTVALAASGAVSYVWNPSSGLNTNVGANVLAFPTVTITYSVIGTDGNGCSSSSTAAITVNPLPNITVAPSSATICEGDSVVLTASGGTSYNWSPSTGLSATSGSTVVAGPSSTTTYTVVGSNGTCSNSATTTVNVNALPVVTVSPASATICSGDSVVLTASGASTYSWSPATGLSVTTGSVVTATPTVSTVYMITGTSPAGCTSTATVSITVTPQLTLTTSSVDASCGSSDGSATVTVSNGTGTYTYLWDDPGTQTTATASNLAAGVYSVLVTDLGTGCDATASVGVNNINGPVLSTATTDVLCYGDNSGSANVTVNGGTAPYIYQWDDPFAQTTPTASNLTAGVYSVIVTDAAGCIGTAVVTITEPGDIVLSTSATSASCSANDGTATVVASGGDGSYSYLWNDPMSQTSSVATNLAAGVYTVFVTDGNGCADSAAVTVNQLNAPSVSATSVNVSCAGNNNGSASAVVSGGTSPYTYQWNDAMMQTTQTASALVAGTYTVIVTDANNCTATAVATITEPSALAIAINTTSASCALANGTASATVTGGTTPYFYQWNDPGLQTTATATGLSAGVYTVNIVDANGCTSNATANVGYSGSLLLNTTVQNVSCASANDGSATVIVTGGSGVYTYQWNDPNTQTSATATGLPPGTYVVNVTDPAGCMGSDTVSITEPNALTLTISSLPTDCGDSTGTATVTVTGGTSPYTYAWNDINAQTAATAIDLASGSYTVTVTDANNCQAVASVAVGTLNGLILNTTTTDISCFGANDGSASVSASGGTAPFSYLWSDPLSQTSATAVNLGPGSYTVTVTDFVGCSGIDSISITEPAPLVISTTSTATTCGNSNGLATANVTGGTAPYAYSWNDPFSQTGSSAVGLTAGTYTVTLTDANGCTASGSATVVAGSSLSIDVTLTHIECYGDSSGVAAVSVSGGSGVYSYAWNDPQGQTVSTAINLPGGTYTVTVTDSIGCIQSVGVLITQPAPIVLASSAVSSTCGWSNGEASVTVVSGGVGPFNYFWSNGGSSNAISAVPYGTYMVDVTDAYGCVASDTVVINDSVDAGCVFIPTAFSPNNDGQHDVWLIENLDYYTQVKVEIYNRWGNLVYSNDDYQNDWNGTRNGDPLPGGVYFYIVDFNDGATPASGSVTIIR